MMCALALYLFVERADLRRAREPAAPPPLFSPVDVSDYPETTLGEEVVRFRYVTVAPQRLRERLLEPFPGSGRLSGNLSITLFDDVVVTLVLTERQDVPQSDGPGFAVLSGGVEGEKYAITTLTVRDGALFARIDMAGRDFRVVPVEPPLHRIDEMKPVGASPNLMIE